MADLSSGAAPRLGDRCRSAAGLLACLATVAGLNLAVPEPGPDHPLEVPAAVGEWTGTDVYRVRVDRAQVVREVRRGSQRVQPAEGTVWVVVDWRVAAQHQTVIMTRVGLQTSAGRYERRPVASLTGQAQTPPGFTDHCQEVFQVPVGRVAEARFEPDPVRPRVVTIVRQVSVDLALEQATLEPSAEISPCQREVS